MGLLRTFRAGAGEKELVIVENKASQNIKNEDVHGKKVAFGFRFQSLKKFDKKKYSRYNWIFA